jgi:hypothetical protein
MRRAGGSTPRTPLLRVSCVRAFLDTCVSSVHALMRSCVSYVPRDVHFMCIVRIVRFMRIVRSCVSCVRAFVRSRVRAYRTFVRIVRSSRRAFHVYRAYRAFHAYRAYREFHAYRAYCAFMRSRVSCVSCASFCRSPLGCGGGTPNAVGPGVARSAQQPQDRLLRVERPPRLVELPIVLAERDPVWSPLHPPGIRERRGGRPVERRAELEAGNHIPHEDGLSIKNN